MNQRDKAESAGWIEKAEQPRPARRASIVMRRLEKLETTSQPCSEASGS
jgi:hypothetical protein